MQTIVIRNTISKFTSLFAAAPRPKLGRWNLEDNQQIKEALANMDSCGDSLCGTPKTYKITINTILNKNTDSLEKKY